jgi:hypothetical protein
MFFRFFFGYFQAAFSSAGRGELDSTTIATNISSVIIFGKDGQRKPICGIELFRSRS